MMHKALRRVAVLTSLALLAGATSEAAAVRFGSTLVAIAAATRGNHVAYDSINHVYLVVSSNGVVNGRFVGRDGTPLGAPFAIQGNPGIFAHFPNVAFSKDANNGSGGFLVTWNESDSSAQVFLHGRMVGFPQGGPYGADNVLTGDPGWWEESPYIAYSTSSQEFLVVERMIGYLIRGTRVSNSATALAPSFTISQTNNFEDNPSAAYNPVTNQYLVCWKGYANPGNFGFVDCRLVQAGTGQLLGGPTRLQVSGGTYITDTTYNPATNQFLVTWYDSTTTATNTYGRLVNADATLPGSVIAVSSRWKGYDGLGVAYNNISRTFFMVSYCNTTEDCGVELTAAGTPVDNGFQVTATGSTKGAFYPGIGAGADDPNWLVSTSAGFVATDTQLVAGTADANGPATPGSGTPPPPPPPPPSPTSRSLIAVDTPRANASVSINGFMVGGWAADIGAAAGSTGVDVVVVWAFPTNGAAAILAGIANYGGARPDVGAYLGSQFTNTGFGMIATLPAGSYTLAICAHSTVNNSWNQPSTLGVTVQAPASRPAMYVDFPGPGQTISQVVHVGGWALDLAAASGPGVDAIHVWAYPQGSQTPVFVGAGTTGGSRPDVGNVFGAQFSTAGYEVFGTLAPGTYTLVVFAHSSVTGTFNNAATVGVTVR
jgi:hypothetical protein